MYIIKIIVMATVSTAKKSRISSRIDSDLKNKSEAILQELGIKPSQAITMFYTQIAERKEFPLELKSPNQETIDALNEDISDYKRYSSVDELMLNLNS